MEFPCIRSPYPSPSASPHQSDDERDAEPTAIGNATAPSRKRPHEGDDGPPAKRARPLLTSSDLMEAVIMGDLRKAQMALEDGVAVNVFTRNGRTPLDHAVARNDLAMVKLLLEGGASPHPFRLAMAKDANNTLLCRRRSEAIALALLLPEPDILLALVRYGANPLGDRSLTHIAEVLNPMNVSRACELALSNRFGIDASLNTTHENWARLYTGLLESPGGADAIAMGCQGAVYLNDPGGAPRIVSAIGQLLENGWNAEHAAHLHAAGCRVDAVHQRADSRKTLTPLCHAARRADLQAATWLIKAGAAVGLAAQHGWTALHFAVGAPNNQALIQLLIDCGADLNAPCIVSLGEESLAATPLTLARTEYLALLIRHGAHPNDVSGAWCDDLNRRSDDVWLDTPVFAVNAVAASQALAVFWIDAPLDVLFEQGIEEPEDVERAQQLLAHGARLNAARPDALANLAAAAERLFAQGKLSDPVAQQLVDCAERLIRSGAIIGDREGCPLARSMALLFGSAPPADVAPDGLAGVLAPAVRALLDPAAPPSDAQMSIFCELLGQLTRLWLQAGLAPQRIRPLSGNWLLPTHFPIAHATLADQQQQCIEALAAAYSPPGQDLLAAHADSLLRTVSRSMVQGIERRLWQAIEKRDAFAFQAALHELEDERLTDLLKQELRSALLILLAGFDVVTGDTLLIACIRAEADTCALALLDLGVSPNQRSWQGFTPLGCAIQNQQDLLVRALIARGAHVGLQTQASTPPNPALPALPRSGDEYSPLHLAIEYCNESAIDALVQAGAVVSPSDVELARDLDRQALLQLHGLVGADHDEDCRPLWLGTLEGALVRHVPGLTTFAD